MWRNVDELLYDSEILISYTKELPAAFKNQSIGGVKNVATDDAIIERTVNELLQKKWRTVIKE